MGYDESLAGTQTARKKLRVPPSAGSACMSWQAVGAAQLGARGRGTLGSDADANADALPTHALLGLGILAGAGHVPTPGTPARSPPL